MGNKELKKKKWKSLKTKWLENVPPEYKIQVEDIEDESEYYHPIIIINKDVSIRAQGDINSNYIYGESFRLNKEQAVGGLLFDISLYINDRTQFEYIVNNFNDIEEKLIKGLENIKKINLHIKSLEIVRDNIIHNSICELIDKSKLQDSISRIYEVSEYLENERLNK